MKLAYSMASNLYWRATFIVASALAATTIRPENVKNKPYFRAKHIRGYCQNKYQNCVIKIIISRGQSLRGSGFDATIQPIRIVIATDIPNLKEKYRLSFCQTDYGKNANLAGIKHNNRLEQVLAKSSINTDEGIMLDEDGGVISATTATKNRALVKSMGADEGKVRPNCRC